ncbi:MAG: MBL fold metallo-hydrolase [Candidatus Alkanophagales archaeon]
MRICEGVYLLKVGELERDGDLIRRASSSVVFIEGVRTLVDSGHRSDCRAILSALEKLGFSPEDVEAIINTHLHRDHTGCNELFRCEKYAHRLQIEAAGAQSAYLPYEEFGSKARSVEIIETPGHCLGHISVVVHADKRVVVAGDAIPRRGNLLQDVPPRLHVDRKAAMRSIRMIKEIADIVVPGHDAPITLRR